MDRSEIKKCYRTGKVRKDGRPRALVVVFKDIATARYWCNDGRGFHFGEHWVNEDLCQADRDAGFFVREERRNRKKKVGEPKQQNHVKVGVPLQDY